ncbi:MAG: heme-binding protein [Proteobacteria bacterium]|nr:heme-binding protein [Pseudomonadota bacterium]
MTRFARRLVKAFFLTAAIPVAAIPAPASPTLTLATAQRMVSTCAGFAGAQKMPPLSIVVLDVSGTLVAFARQDGASPASAEVALRKARSALQARVPTSALAKAAQDAPTRDGLIALGLLSIPGGIPFPAGAPVPLGAVGVSGADPATDERCAGAAVAAFQAAER